MSEKQTSITPEKKRRIRGAIGECIGRVACGVAVLLAGENILSPSDEDSDKIAEQTVVAVAFNEQLSPRYDRLQDMKVIIINNPEVSLEDDTTEESARSVLRDASIMMSGPTDGAISIPSDISIYTTEYLPTGKLPLSKNDTDVYACMSNEDIENARTQVLAENRLPSIVRTPIIINGGPTCSKNTAWAMKGKDKNIQTIYNGAFNARVVTHEEAHVNPDGKGLMHASTIVCPEPNEADPRLPGDSQSRSETDIAELLRMGCDIARYDDGTPNEYTDSFSVMGQLDSDLKDVYNFVEVNKISSQASRIETLQEYNQSRVISLEKGKLRGIRLDLPEEHPLRVIDPSLRFLNVGVQNAGEESPVIRVVASGEKTSYALEYVYIFNTGFDTEKRVLYTDKTLGAQISVETVEFADTVNRDKIRVSVESIPQ